MASNNQTSDDIRDQDIDISQKLLTTWPRNEHDSADKSSGINCTLMLIRTVYGHLTRVFANKDRLDIVDFESKNPFMSFAWKDLSSSRPIIEQLCHAVWKRPIDGVELNSLTFDEIITSAEMCTTLWSVEEGRPYRDVIWRPLSTQTWSTLSEATLPPNVDALVQSVISTPVPNLIFVAATPKMDLGQEIRKRFGTFRFDDDKAKVYIGSSPCSFMHLRFEVQNVSVDNPLNFDDFTSFNFDIYDLRDSGRVKEWTIVDKRLYCLVALVRHRTSSEGIDSMRIYALDGKCQTPNIKAAYANPTWKLADFANGDVFTGIFMYNLFSCVERPRFPELPVREAQWDRARLELIAQRMDTEI